jgi:hypothetical protein
MSAAPTAVEHRTTVDARNVTGSVGLMSYSCDSTKWPNAQMHGSAIAVPAAIITSTSRSTSRHELRGSQPGFSGGGILSRSKRTTFALALRCFLETKRYRLPLFSGMLISSSSGALASCRSGDVADD